MCFRGKGKLFCNNLQTKRLRKSFLCQLHGLYPQIYAETFHFYINNV